LIKIIFSKVLNKRLDTRVDDMISNGLLKEIENFKNYFESKFSG
jgi:tRNA A37 N6-isopentenylltransferase MiaA